MFHVLTVVSIGACQEVDERRGRKGLQTEEGVDVWCVGCLCHIHNTVVFPAAPRFYLNTFAAYGGGTQRQGRRLFCRNSSVATPRRPTPEPQVGRGEQSLHSTLPTAD